MVLQILLQPIQLAVNVEMVPAICSKVLSNVLSFVLKPSVFPALFEPNIFSGPQSAWCDRDHVQNLCFLSTDNLSEVMNICKVYFSIHHNNMTRLTYSCCQCTDLPVFSFSPISQTGIVLQASALGLKCSLSFQLNIFVILLYSLTFSSQLLYPPSVLLLNCLVISRNYTAVF